MFHKRQKCSQAVSDLAQTNLHSSCPGGFQLYIYIGFLPILWHPQSLQQLLQTWLRFQASQGCEKNKGNKEIVGLPMLIAVEKQASKCCKCKQPGILQYLYVQTVECYQYYQDQKM